METKITSAHNLQPFCTVWTAISGPEGHNNTHSNFPELSSLWIFSVSRNGPRFLFSSTSFGHAGSFVTNGLFASGEES